MNSPAKPVLLASIFAAVAAATPFWVNGTVVTPCTSTISTTIRPPPFAATTWPMVLTMTTHTVTDTEYKSIYCGGCRYYSVAPTVLGGARPETVPPASIEIYTAPEPTTVTVTHCVGFSNDIIPVVAARDEPPENVAPRATATVQDKPSPSPTAAASACTSTVTAAGPAVAAQFQCSPPTLTTELPSFWTPPPSVPQTVFPYRITSPSCTRTIGLAPDSPGSTLTVFRTTVTQTSRRNCGTCALVWSTAPYEFPDAVVSYATTVWKKKSIATALTCSKPRRRPLGIHTAFDDQLIPDAGRV